MEIVARLLEPQDREVVLGDLEEQQQPVWICILEILGFAVRQQAEFWRTWRPWVAGGVTIPASLLLMGASFQLSLDSLELLQAGDFREALAYEAALTIAWAWASGFVVATVSRRTRWISLLLCAIPCLFCLMQFREPSLWSPCLLLFLPFAISGALLGQRRMRLDLIPSAVLALSTTGIMLSWNGMPTLNWLLALPAWYIAWTSARPNDSRQDASHDHA